MSQYIPTLQTFLNSHAHGAYRYTTRSVAFVVVSKLPFSTPPPCTPFVKQLKKKTHALKISAKKAHAYETNAETKSESSRCSRAFPKPNQTHNLSECERTRERLRKRTHDLSVCLAARGKESACHADVCAEKRGAAYAHLAIESRQRNEHHHHHHHRRRFESS